VPYFLTEAQKQDRVDYCLEMLEKFDGGRSKRVYDVITDDESWFYYYDPEMKRQSQVWVASNDPSPTKVRTLKKKMVPYENFFGTKWKPSKRFRKNLRHVQNDC